MNKIIYLLFLVFSFLATAQTAEQAERSSDPKVIAGFIKNNPSDPKVPQLRRKLFALINNTKSPAEQAKVAKPTIAPLTPKTAEAGLSPEKKNAVIEAARSSNPSKALPKPTDAKTQQTVAMLNHLFNSDPSSGEALIQIKNKSRCNLIVKISGPKFYNLSVPVGGNNFIMVKKGSYRLTTSVCDAAYSSLKKVNRDLVITLNAPGARK